MVRRRAVAAEIGTAIGNHSFRATGITPYLKNGGPLETAATMANHSSTRTTQLYDRRPDEVMLEAVERVLIYVPGTALLFIVQSLVDQTVVNVMAGRRGIGRTGE